MEFLGKNEGLLKRLIDKLTLLDGRIQSITFYNDKNGLLVITILLEILYYKEKSQIKLVLNDIIEYSFYYQSQYSFYNIEWYKLRKVDDYFYLSLDPSDTTDERSYDDQDFIACGNIEGYLIKIIE